MTGASDGETSVQPIPKGGLLLHIGPHKTGTTTVQRAFVARRDALAEHGVAYPSKSEAPHGAVIARLRTRRGWYDEIEPGPVRRWERLCAITRSLTDTVVISSEALCHADDGQAREVCGELHPGSAHVVITLRPLEQLLPSMWQEYVKAGWTTPYAEYLEWTLRRPGDAANPVWTFWVRQDHGRLVERWSRALGAENVTVIVADRGRPRLLLDAFEDLLALPRNFLDGGAAGISNRSLTWAECEMLRAVNTFARRELTWEQYNALLRMGAFRELVDGRRPAPDETPLGLPDWATSEARSHSRQAVDRIRAAGVRVVGSLDALAPTESPAAWNEPDELVLPIDACSAAASGLMSAPAPPVARPDSRRGAVGRG